MNYIYSLSGSYDLNDIGIDWSKTILLDKKNGKMIVAGGLLEFKFTDISDEFKKLVTSGLKQTALSQAGAHKLYKDLYDITEVIKGDVSKLSEEQQEKITKIGEQIAAIMEELGTTEGEGSSESIKAIIEQIKTDLGKTQDEVSTLSSELNKVDERLLGAENDINVLEENSSEMALEFNKLKDWGNLVNTTLGKHDDALKAVDASIESIKSDISGLKTDYAQKTYVDGKFDTLNASVNTNFFTKSEIGTKLEDLKSSILGSATDAFDTLQEVEAWINTHNSSAAGYFQKIADLSTYIDESVDASITSLLDSVGKLDTSAKNVEGRLKSAEDTIAALDDNYASKSAFETWQGKVNASIGSLETSVGKLEQADKDINASISSINSSIAALEERDEFDASEFEAWQKVIDGSVNTLEDWKGTIASWKTEIDTFKDTTVPGTYATKTEVNGVKSDLSTLETKVSDISTRVDAIEETIEDYESLATKSDVSAVEVKVGEVSTRLANFQSSVAETYVTQSAYNTKVTELTNKDASLDASIVSILSTIETINSDLDDKVAQSAYDAKVSEIDSSISGLKSKDNALDASIKALDASLVEWYTELEKVYSGLYNNLNTRLNALENA